MTRACDARLKREQLARRKPQGHDKAHWVPVFYAGEWRWAPPEVDLENFRKLFSKAEAPRK